MAVSCDAASITAAAKCFDCIPREMWGPVELYLLALAAGGSTNPATLLAAAKCSPCVPREMDEPVEIYLYTVAASISSDSAALVAASKCFHCIPPKVQIPAALYLLALAAAASTDSATLVAASKCFRCVPVSERIPLRNYLLCQASGTASCSSSDLTTAAKCFRCVPVSRRQAVKTYLLCQGVNFGFGTGPNIVPPGATYNGAGTYTLNVDPNTTYIVIWGTNDLSFNMCGDVYTNPGNGNQTVIYTGACTTLVFTGLGGSTVTAQVHKPKPGSKTPVPSGFTWTASGTNAVAGWNLPPGFVDSTELWTSTDNVTFTLAATVARPGVTASVAAPTPGNSKYGKIRWISSSSFPSVGPFTASKYLNGTVADWVKRVGINGGAVPSAATQSAMNTFVDSLVTAGIDSKMATVICIVPDNLIAAITPLYKVTGNDPWTNSGFVGANLTVNGLIGDGTKTLDTGLNPNTFYGASSNAPAGLALYNFTSLDEFKIDFGAQNNTGGTDFSLYISFGNTTYTDCWANSGTGRINAANAAFAGFLSFSRTDGSHLTSYIANSVTPFQVLASNAAGGTNGAPPNFSVICFGYNNNGVITAQSVKRFSWAGIFTTGLTSTETQALFNAIQALRTAFGGGFI